MNKQELEEYEMLGEKLICIPSGLKRKDGTDVMSLTLRKWVEEEKTEENNTYVEYEDTIEYEIKDCYLIKEDEEKHIYENKPEEENDKKGEKETKLQSKSVTNSEHDKLFKSLFSNVEETAEFLNKELNFDYKFKANKYTREELLHDNLIITKAMLLDREEDINDIKKDLDIIIDKEKIKKSTRYKEQLLILLQYLFINEKYIAIRADLQRLIEELKGDDEPVLRAAKIIDEEFEKAERRGEKRGEKKGKQEVAKAMKEDKLSYEFISKFTGLKLEEIEAL